MPNNLANAQDLVSVDEIKERTVVLKGGKLLKILMVDGMNFSLKSEEEQNIVTSLYQNFLNGIGFPLQIIIHSRKINIDKYLGSLEERQSQESSALLQSQIAEYREFVKSFVKDNPIMTKTFLVVVPFSSISTPKKESFMKIFPFIKMGGEEKKKAEAEEEQSFRQHLLQLDQRVNQVIDGLRAIGLEAVVLDDQALIELFYNFYNPETVERESIKLPTQETNNG